VGGVKRRPLISPHFSKRIWSVAFGDAHFSFGEEEVRVNHSACVKNLKFLLEAISSRITILLFDCDNLTRQLFGCWVIVNK
jgi:hypothetical protein